LNQNILVVKWKEDILQENFTNNYLRLAS